VYVVFGFSRTVAGPPEGGHYVLRYRGACRRVQCSAVSLFRFGWAWLRL